MKGLIKYDFMQLASGIKGGFILLYLIVMAIMNVFSGDGNMFSYIIIFVGGMFGISAFNYEETYHWDRFTAALPLTNRQIVLARYGMVGICVVLGVAASLLLGAISVIAGTMEISLYEWILSMVQCLAIAMIYLEIMIPIMYRFGSERGRVVSLLLFLIFFSLTCVVIAFIDVSEYDVTIYSVMLALVAVAIILLPISFAIAARVRAKKEF
ncbi:MAG: ABC-2 transporter permease [Eubacteriales bacterium]|nr:ABC-2 transporter permease [Eubacteriales bacterium]